MRRIHATLRARLVVTGLITSLLLVGGVGAFLLWNQAQQATATVGSDAIARAGIARQVLDRVAEPELEFAATDFASQPALQTALATTPGTTVPAILQAHDPIQIPGANIAVFSRSGNLAGDVESVASGLPASSLPSLQAAAFGSAGTAMAPVHGVELVGGSTAALDVAVPVRGSDGTLLGAVLYSAPLDGLISRYGPVIGPYAVIVSVSGAQPQRISASGALSAVTLPAAVTTALTPAADATQPAVSAAYAAPQGDVVAAATPLLGPSGNPTGYVAVEAPLSGVAAQTGTGGRAIVVIALSAALLMTFALLVLADRFLRRPVARLERNVAAIAAGDYESPITIAGRDEVGRLAASVEKMRAAIAEANHRRDSSDLELRAVSRALTATTSGTHQLRRAMVAAAQAIAGGASWADLTLRSEDGMLHTDILDKDALARVLEGEIATTENDGRRVIAVPMVMEDRVAGILTVAHDTELQASAVNALTILANNGAIALATTRVYEQERDALRVMRDLHAMKSDFMAIAQHELRTPVHAILGYIELLGMTWGTWNDEQRAEALTDIETSTRQLAAIVENIVNFSLLSGDGAGSKIPIPVAPAIARAIDDVTRLYRNGRNVRIETRCTPGLTAQAGEDRFHIALRCLIDNAVKFSRPGGLVSIVAQRESDTLIRVDVLDNGTGIPAAALDRVFDRFYQADAGVSRAHSGMGLGLAVVKRVCEESSAKVTVASVDGRGSTFSLIWPAGPAPER